MDDQRLRSRAEKGHDTEKKNSRYRSPPGTSIFKVKAKAKMARYRKGFFCLTKFLFKKFILDLRGGHSHPSSHTGQP